MKGREGEHENSQRDEQLRTVRRRHSGAIIARRPVPAPRHCPHRKLRVSAEAQSTKRPILAQAPRAREDPFPTPRSACVMQHLVVIIVPFAGFTQSLPPLPDDHWQHSESPNGIRPPPAEGGV